MANFWLELPEGRRDISSALDVLRALWECPSLGDEGALAAAARWDSAAGFARGARAITGALRECGMRVGNFSPQALAGLSVGQVLYLVIISAPDGLTEGQVLGRAADWLVGETVGAAAYVLRRLVQLGYVQAAGGIYCAPGPVPPTWGQL